MDIKEINQGIELVCYRKPGWLNLMTAPGQIGKIETNNIKIK